jgi:predicted esterase
MSIAVTRERGFEHVLRLGTTGWTLLLLHGTGGDEHQLVPLGRRLAPGATLLSPRGQILEHGTNRRFFRRWAPGVLDVPDLIERSDQLAGFVAAATARHGLDPTQVVAVGFSNGANVAAALLLRHPGLLRGAVLLRPMLPLPAPDQAPELAGTAVLVLAAEHDEQVPVASARALTATLRAAGAAVDEHVDPAAGHALAADDLVRAEAWTRTLTQQGGRGDD